jgi:hypothetical protein
LDLILKKDEHNEVLETVLLPDQIKWLRQAELQLRLSENKSTFGLKDRILAEELKLSDDQSRRIQEIAKKYERRELDYANKVKSAVKNEIIKSIDRSLGVLTKEQSALYQHLLGNVETDLK